jgi:Tfp pilus assembly protein PilX
MQTVSKIHASQRGAALFMALIFLLVMTILGVFGMNISRLENLMAGNTQFQVAALSNAELTLSVAEQRIENILGALPFSDWNEGGDPFYDRTGTSTEIINPQKINWDFAYQAEGSTSRYVIEYSGSELIPGEDESYEASATCPAGSCVWVFLATAQNETSRGAKRTVQSVYVTATPP